MRKQRLIRVELIQKPDQWNTHKVGQYGVDYGREFANSDDVVVRLYMELDPEVGTSYGYVAGSGRAWHGTHQMAALTVTSSLLCLRDGAPSVPKTFNAGLRKLLDEILHTPDSHVSYRPGLYQSTRAIRELLPLVRQLGLDTKDATDSLEWADSSLQTETYDFTNHFDNVARTLQIGTHYERSLPVMKGMLERLASLPYEKDDTK